MKQKSAKSNFCKSGFTLVEMVCVILLVGIAASLAAQKFAGVRRNAEITAAESDMLAIRNAFRSPGGYLDDMGHIPGFSCGMLRTGNLLVATNVFGVGGVRVDDGTSRPGYAPETSFLSWDASQGRGWNGPYLKTGAGNCAHFPAAGDRRSPDDRTFSERGFFPNVKRLKLPEVFINASNGHSVYGFCGEAAVLDPWGNPYVIQTPPPQAFPDVRNVSDETRFRYARIVSAGPDGVLSTPCYFENFTNNTDSTWSNDLKSGSRLAGKIPDGTAAARGDDLVLFLGRTDVYEEFK